MLNTVAEYLYDQTSLYSLCWILLLSYGLYLLAKLFRFVTRYSYIRWRLPGPKLDHPIFGMKVARIDRKSLAKLENTIKDYPRFGRMIYGPIFSIMVTGPEVAQQIFNQVESKNKTFVYMMTPWLGNGLVFSEGTIWKRNRKLLTPTFYYQSLINFVKIMNKSSDRMIEVINRDSNGKDPIEFVPLIHNMTLEVILNCICSKGSDLQLNIDTNSREMTYVEGLEKIRQGMEERFSSFFSIFDIIFYRKNVGKEFARGAKMTKQYIVSLIQEREENPREESNKSDYDMLDLLTRSRDEEGNGLTQKEIIDELNTFVFAGHDTTGAASSFVFYHLAKYPELQEKCREEVLSVMGGRDEIEWKDIAKFTYLTCFIKETMRLYPPVMFISKMLNKPFTIDGHKIPANVSLDISIGLIHRNASHWPDPDKFDPSRFKDENIEKHHPYAFIPFSAGSRNCIGQNFAMSEIKIITARLLKKFQVSLQDGYDIDITVKVVLSPSDNLPLLFSPL